MKMSVSSGTLFGCDYIVVKYVCDAMTVETFPLIVCLLHQLKSFNSFFISLHKWKAH